MTRLVALAAFLALLCPALALPLSGRHTHALTMLSAGEHPMWVAKQMGHADWTMIARVYGRWMPRPVPGRWKSSPEMLANRTPNWQKAAGFSPTRKIKPLILKGFLVRGRGLEPLHHCWRQDLNLVRLPISPPSPDGSRRPLSRGAGKEARDYISVVRVFPSLQRQNLPGGCGVMFRPSAQPPAPRAV